MTPTRQHANGARRLLQSLFFAIFALLVLPSQSFVVAQSAIELKECCKLRYDGLTDSEVLIEGKLIDGFSYKLPVELSVADGIALIDLSGKAVCQCASLQFDSTSVSSINSLAKGSILLRPKSAEIAYTLDAFGTVPGSLDPIRIGRARVRFQVFAPVSPNPASIEVNEGKFTVSEIHVRTSNGVEILDGSMSDSNSEVSLSFDRDKKLFRTVASDSRLREETGELVGEFLVKYKGMQTTFRTTTPYAPKPTARVIPSVVSFRSDSEGYLGRVVVLGFDPLDTKKPTLKIEKRIDGEWVQTDITVRIDQMGFGKAIGKIVLPSKQTLVEPTVKSKLRLWDSGANAAFAEFEAVLVD